VLLLASAVLAAFSVVAFSIRIDQSSGEPPAARALPAGALEDEQLPVGQLLAPNIPAKDPLVDLVDRNAPAPRRIHIASIGVSARVIPLRLNANHTMETPKNFSEAGWFEPGHEPGEQGPAVVVGHVDSKTGPAVFYKLRKLRRGDLIRIVRADRSVVRFRVEGLERWPKADFPTKKVFGRTRTSTLRLVTCSGNFDPKVGHYVDNTIVYAVRVPSRAKR
jgi:sortase (surface protein transpeptidase)